MSGAAAAPDHAGVVARRRPRIAVNPIPYWAVGGKSREVFERAFADLADLGITAVKADVPEGMSVAGYTQLLQSFGLVPSLSLFSSPFDETIRLADEVERAKRFAATQVELGLDRTMVSSMSLPARMREPAVGAGFDSGRLARGIEMCGAVCEAMLQEGLRALHHSHVGGLFEVEAEIVRLLDELGPDLIGFGPDTGHLTWAGVDPARLITRYADRIGGIHVKDCFGDYLDAGARAGMSYEEVASTRRLWAEPGLGVVDFDAVLAAVPSDYDGDFMIEVDVPSVESVKESNRLSYEWAKSTLGVRWMLR
jgi:inosose dehydratase